MFNDYELCFSFVLPFDNLIRLLDGIVVHWYLIFIYLIAKLITKLK